MKKLMMFVATMMVICTGCASSRNTTMTEKKDEIVTEAQKETRTENKTALNEKFSDTSDWHKIENMISDVLAFRQDNALRYEPNGVYHLTDYSKKVYTFDAPNDFYEVVMMDDSENFITIIHNTGANGVSFQSLVYKEGTFYGLSTNYVLFKKTDNSIIAVSIKEISDCKEGEYSHYVENFDSLSDDEKNSAIYPSNNYICQF